MYTQRDGFADFPRSYDEILGSEEDVIKALEEFGYLEVWRIGCDHGGGDAAKAWESDSPKAPAPFVVEVETDSTWDLVFVATRGDLLALRIQLAGHIAPWMAYVVQELHDMAAKAFHAMHGHYHHNTCHHCDPHAMELEELSRVSARERKARS
jgi:hypothetical protein